MIQYLIREGFCVPPNSIFRMIRASKYGTDRHIWEQWSLTTYKTKQKTGYCFSLYYDTYVHSVCMLILHTLLFIFFSFILFLLLNVFCAYAVFLVPAAYNVCAGYAFQPNLYFCVYAFVMFSIDHERRSQLIMRYQLPSCIANNN